MNMQRNQRLARATALLSAIAASSLLGLPALAGGAVAGAAKPGDQAQTTIIAAPMQCDRTAQLLPPRTATPDAVAPEASQLPNQADPRAGLPAANEPMRQPSQAMTGTMIAQCPSEAMPQTQSEMRRSPDQSAPRTQTAPQPISPQMRQSPFDTNDSRTR